MLATVPILTGCTTAAVTTSQTAVSSTPITRVNHPDEINNFLDASRERYYHGIDCSSVTLEPKLDISEEAFDSLRAGTETVFYMAGAPYSYAAISGHAGQARRTVEIDDFLVSFADPEAGATRTGGGMAVNVSLYRDGSLQGEQAYHGTIFNLINAPAGVTCIEAGDALILSVYYKPECESLEMLTLVLVPVPEPVDS